MTYGVPHDDRAFDVLVTEDGGYILVGDQADEHATNNDRDVIVIKTDATDSRVLVQSQDPGRRR